MKDKHQKRQALENKNKKVQKSGLKRHKRKSRVLPIISKLMPYILAVLFVVMLFTLIGKLAFSNVLYGLFSTFAPVFILTFLLYHSLMWYYDTHRKICTRRVICSVIIVIAVSMIQHLITVNVSDSIDWVYKASEGIAVNKPTVFELYAQGKNGLGGGVIGGLLCGGLLSLFGQGFTIAIILILVVFMFLQMFNITPATIVKSIFRERIEQKQAKKAEQKRRAELKKKRKKFHFCVDESDDDELLVPTVDPRIIQAMSEDDPIEHSDSSADDDDDFEIERQPVFDAGAPVNAPIQRSSSPYRFVSEPVVQVSDESDDDDNEGFVLGGATFKSEESDDGVDDYDEIDYDKAQDDVDNDSDSSYEMNDDGAVDANDGEGDDDLPFVEPARATDTDLSSDDFDDSDNDAQPVSEEKEKRSLFSALFKRDGDDKDNGDAKNESEKNEGDKFEKTAKVGLFGKGEKTEKQEKKEEKKEEKKPPKKKKKHIFPSLDLFDVSVDTDDEEAVNAELQEKARIIVETLKSFNISTKIVDIARGPTITRYELMPDAGVQVRSIAKHIDDISLYLAAEGVRIECPIPGKMAVGIEVPNNITSMVYLRSLLEDPKFKQSKSPVTCAVGKSVSGENVYVDLAKLVHLLVAGATGQGKSVCINSLLTSLLYKASPDDVRLILIDPKRVEFAPYNGIPHLLVPVVTDVKKSIGTLQWSVSEMERRFAVYEECGARKIEEYNDRVERGAVEGEKMYRIVIVIDELYDLKMQVPEIDDYIIRLTQKARAAGIHVIIGTQRPSVDVITGVIKSNIPSRIAFRVPALVDSRTILDEAGAEKLVARGDMLLKPVGALKPTRVQGAFISEDECERITSFLRENSSENYDESIVSQIESNASKLQKAEKRNDDGDGDGGSDLDDKFYAALEIAVDSGKISSSYLQRKLNLGFQRAARIIDTMEELGYIGEPNGSKPRDVLITKQDFLELMMRRNEDDE